MGHPYIDSEGVPQDYYEHPESSLEYILENVLQESETDSQEYKSLRENFNSVLINRCECLGPKTCDDGKCGHGGNYVRLDDRNEVVLNTDRGSDIFYECSSMCKCNITVCNNRLVQNGPRRHLKIINSARCGSKGLSTTEDIPIGGFICEYAGELLTKKEARRRIMENERYSKMNYIFCLNEMPQRKIEDPLLCGECYSTIVDPSRRGNIGRYLNHSCEPNCQVCSVRVDCPFPKIGIFAKRQILAGEELCFNYSEGVKNLEAFGDDCNSLTRCLCGSKKCRGFLPKVEF